MMRWNLFGCLCLIALSPSYGLSDCMRPPLECPNENVTFWLYTRQNQFNPHQIYALDANSIKSAPWVADAPIKILIHGYTGFKDSSPNTEIRPAYMQCCNYNIISVDYNPIAREPCYEQAAANTELVGKCTAQLIDSLVNHGFALSRFHVIGFSLGGHTAGFIGNYLTSGKLDRVTGLDPAIPLFKDVNKTRKLDPSDGKFVDVLHTNSLQKGILGRSGHVDFYGNTWLYQRGCLDGRNQIRPGCNHARAPAYYAESIITRVGFYATPCLTWLSYINDWCIETETQNEILFGEYVPYGNTIPLKHSTEAVQIKSVVTSFPLPQSN